MAAPPPPPTQKIHTLLDRLSNPDVVGVVPGSLKTSTDIRRLDARLAPAEPFTFIASSLNLEGALVGAKCELVALCRAKTADGSDIPDGDLTIGLQEEASNLFWTSLTLIINDREIAHIPRADIVRHMIDRFHQNTRNAVESLTAYRQLNRDRDLVLDIADASLGTFKSDMIQEGKRFELVRPLNDLPFFADGDSLIPGFNTVRIQATTTSAPQSLFKTTSAITDSPYLLVESVQLRYVTVKLEPLVAKRLQTLSAGGELQISGSLWSAANLTPRIDKNATSWAQGVSTAFGTTPDIAYFVAFPQASFVPPANGFTGSLHPLVHTWAGASRIEFISGSGDILRDYRNTKGIGGKVELLREVGKALATQGGVDSTSVALTDVAAISPETFVAEPGVGAAVLYRRNWGETDTHVISPISLRVNAELNETATGNPGVAQPYLISKTRHRWVLSTTEGATRIIV